MTHTLRLATRGSPLALAQSRSVAAHLASAHPGLSCELVIVKTTGDHLQTAHPDAPAPAKGLFTKEIEEALLSGQADFAVHSLKDLPVAETPGLTLAAIPPREDPADALILQPQFGSLNFPPGTEILTGSPRRRVQWHTLHPATSTRAIRGNIDTRLRKLREGTAAGLILALAGLRRLHLPLGDCLLRTFPPDEMVPAPGQGALALQCRHDDPATLQHLAALEHPPTRAAVTAERAFLAAMGGGCLAPAGALAQPLGPSDQLQLRVAWAADETSPLHRATVEGSLHDPVALGQAAAELITHAAATP